MDNDTMLFYHLRYNLYPSLDGEWVRYAKKAIELVDTGCPLNRIVLPNRQVVTAEEVVENLNLHCFLKY